MSPTTIPVIGNKKQYNNMVASPYVDETFDINKCQNYILSIQCALDGFSFLVYDTSVKKFIVLAVYNIISATPYQLKNNLTTIFTSEPILNQKYKRVNCTYITNKITLAPKSLISTEDECTLFGQVFEQNADEEIIVDDLEQGYKILSAIPRQIKTLLAHHFCKCNFFTPVRPLLAYSANFTSLYQQLYVVKYNRTIQLMVIKNKNIEFFNSFFVSNDTDCLYYILNVAEQLWATPKTDVILMGKIAPKSPLVSLLKKYFTRVKTARYSNRYTVSYTFSQEPENYYLPFIELALCE